MNLEKTILSFLKKGGHWMVLCTSFVEYEDLRLKLGIQKNSPAFQIIKDRKAIDWMAGRKDYAVIVLPGAAITREDIMNWAEFKKVPVVRLPHL